MTAREYVAAEAAAGRTVVLTVLHPEHETLQVPAFSVLDAKTQAALAWGVDFSETGRMKVCIEKRNITPPASCRTVTDRRLMEICGEHFAPWEERYRW